MVCAVWMQYRLLPPKNSMCCFWRFMKSVQSYKLFVFLLILQINSLNSNEIKYLSIVQKIKRLTILQENSFEMHFKFSNNCTLFYKWWNFQISFSINFVVFSLVIGNNSLLSNNRTVDIVRRLTRRNFVCFSEVNLVFNRNLLVFYV